MDLVTDQAPPLTEERSSFWGRISATRGALIGWAVASMIGNILIIVTGAVVRLTESGLGCPTWPRCQPDSYVPRSGLGHHQFIEFGNRLLTFVLIFLAIMVFVAAVRTHADRLTRRIAFWAGLGIPFQGVIGGITVLTDLNPWVVALHLMLSLVLVAALTKLVLHVAGSASVPVPALALWASRAAFAGMMVACGLGTVVTGSGPHSGDGGAKRTGLDIPSVARIHSLSVWFTVLCTLVALYALRRAGSAAVKWAAILLGVELVQGAIGYYQYFNGVPIVAVLMHMVGAGVAVAAAAALFFSVRGEGEPATIA